MSADSQGSRRRTPRKQEGQALGRRSFNGSVKDVAAMAERLGVSEGKIRSATDRGLLPYRKWGGRIIFISSEVEAFFAALPGVSAAEALSNLVARRSSDGD